ncbi:MAG: hypothetical protein V3U79_11895, partial [Dehalococcoidia bacterium]
LDVNDRTQAVLAGLRHGWITLGEASLNGKGFDVFASNRSQGSTASVPANTPPLQQYTSA